MTDTAKAGTIPMRSKITVEGYEVRCGSPKPIGNGAHIYVPLSWINKRIYLIRVS